MDRSKMLRLIEGCEKHPEFRYKGNIPSCSTCAELFMLKVHLDEELAAEAERTNQMSEYYRKNPNYPPGG